MSFPACGNCCNGETHVDFRRDGRWHRFLGSRFPGEFSGTEIQMLVPSSILGTGLLPSLISALEHPRTLVAAPQARPDPRRFPRPLRILPETYGTTRHRQALLFLFIHIRVSEAVWVPEPGLSPGHPQAARPRERVGEPCLQFPSCTSWVSGVSWFKVKLIRSSHFGRDSPDF